MLKAKAKRWTDEKRAEAEAEAARKTAELQSLREQAERETRRAEEAERLRNEADELRLKAENAEKQIRQALEEAEKARLHADLALAKAQKLTSAFYFYKDKFALASKTKEYTSEVLFYFIDKNADAVSNLGEWDRAEQFDATGFAKVRKKVNDIHIDYLIDTDGHSYRVAYDLQDLSKEITALDLRGETTGYFSNRNFATPPNCRCCSSSD